MKLLLVFLFSFLYVNSCIEGYRYNTGYFPEEVKNFEAVNSVYNDYNSAAPFIYNHHWLNFSSDRNSYGEDFDIVGEKMYLNWNKDNGKLEIGTDNSEFWFDYLAPLFDTINSDCNELGPYSIAYQEYINNSETNWKDIYLFASDCKGDYDIHFISSEYRFNSGDPIHSIGQVKDVSFLNSGYNDMYPTLYGEDFYQAAEWGADPSKVQELYFASDREGYFNIYEIDLPEDPDISSFLGSSNTREIKKTSLCSASNDQCPFINGKVMVFASDRQGGFGGYDLYYSLRNGDQWSQPRNFGESINTEYDEFRPIVLFYWEFENNLMIFSSNRPEGKGGFDLYYTGIKQMVN